MYKSGIAVMVVALSLSGAVHADDAHHPEQGASGKPAATKPAKPPTGQEGGMAMDMMQENMLKMHEQMHKIMQSKDPKERERLVQEHMGMMQQQMKNMHGCMGDGMMGSGMMGGDGKGGMKSAPAGK
jgi:hypothetical protein